MPTTTNYAWTLPTISASYDTWGAEINQTLSDIDAKVFAVEGQIGDALPTTGGTLTGPLTGTTATFTTVTADLTGDASGNAGTATKLETARTITLSGAVAGSATFDGSANATLATSVPNNALTIAKTSGLQAALDGKLPKSGGAVTGNITRGGGGAHLYHGASFQSGRITVSSSAPSGGSDGDIWFQT